MSEQGKDFIVRCLELDESKRWSANEALDHIWIQDALSRARSENQRAIATSNDQDSVPSNFAPFAEVDYVPEPIRVLDEHSRYPPWASRHVSSDVPTCPAWAVDFDREV
eukprot:364100-Chlamydomonas_euryale.AAC.40